MDLVVKAFVWWVVAVLGEAGVAKSRSQTNDGSPVLGTGTRLPRDLTSGPGSIVGGGPQGHTARSMTHEREPGEYIIVDPGTPQDHIARSVAEALAPRSYITRPEGDAISPQDNTARSVAEEGSPQDHITRPESVDRTSRDHSVVQAGTRPNHTAPPVAKETSPQDQNHLYPSVVGTRAPSNPTDRPEVERSPYYHSSLIADAGTPHSHTPPPPFPDEGTVHKDASSHAIPSTPLSKEQTGIRPSLLKHLMKGSQISSLKATSNSHQSDTHTTGSSLATDDMKKDEILTQHSTEKFSQPVNRPSQVKHLEPQHLENKFQEVRYFKLPLDVKNLESQHPERRPPEVVNGETQLLEPQNLENNPTWIRYLDLQHSERKPLDDRNLEQHLQSRFQAEQYPENEPSEVKHLEPKYPKGIFIDLDHPDKKHPEVTYLKQQHPKSQTPATGSLEPQYPQFKPPQTKPPGFRTVEEQQSERKPTEYKELGPQHPQKTPPEDRDLEMQPLKIKPSEIMQTGSQNPEGNPLEKPAEVEHQETQFEGTKPLNVRSLGSRQSEKKPSDVWLPEPQDPHTKFLFQEMGTPVIGSLGSQQSDKRSTDFVKELDPQYSVQKPQEVDDQETHNLEKKPLGVLFLGTQRSEMKPIEVKQVEPQHSEVEHLEAQHPEIKPPEEIHQQSKHPKENPLEVKYEETQYPEMKPSGIMYLDPQYTERKPSGDTFSEHQPENQTPEEVSYPRPHLQEEEPLMKKPIEVRSLRSPEPQQPKNKPQEARFPVLQQPEKEPTESRYQEPQHPQRRHLEVVYSNPETWRRTSHDEEASFLRPHHRVRRSEVDELFDPQHPKRKPENDRQLRIIKRNGERYDVSSPDSHGLEGRAQVGRNLRPLQPTERQQRDESLGELETDEHIVHPAFEPMHGTPRRPGRGSLRPRPVARQLVYRGDAGPQHPYSRPARITSNDYSNKLPSTGSYGRLGVRSAITQEEPWSVRPDHLRQANPVDIDVVNDANPFKGVLLPDGEVIEPIDSAAAAPQRSTPHNSNDHPGIPGNIDHNGRDGMYPVNIPQHELKANVYPHVSKQRRRGFLGISSSVGSDSSDGDASAVSSRDYGSKIRSNDGEGAASGSVLRVAGDDSPKASAHDSSVMPTGTDGDSTIGGVSGYLEKMGKDSSRAFPGNGLEGLSYHNSPATRHDGLVASGRNWLKTHDTDNTGITRDGRTMGSDHSGGAGISELDVSGDDGSSVTNPNAPDDSGIKKIVPKASGDLFLEVIGDTSGANSSRAIGLKTSSEDTSPEDSDSGGVPKTSDNGDLESHINGDGESPANDKSQASREEESDVSNEEDSENPDTKDPVRHESEGISRDNVDDNDDKGDDDSNENESNNMKVSGDNNPVITVDSKPLKNDFDTDTKLEDDSKPDNQDDGVRYTPLGSAREPRGHDYGEANTAREGRSFDPINSEIKDFRKGRSEDSRRGESKISSNDGAGDSRTSISEVNRDGKSVIPRNTESELDVSDEAETSVSDVSGKGDSEVPESAESEVSEGAEPEVSQRDKSEVSSSSESLSKSDVPEVSANDNRKGTESVESEVSANDESEASGRSESEDSSGESGEHKSDEPDASGSESQMSGTDDSGESGTTTDSESEINDDSENSTSNESELSGNHEGEEVPGIDESGASRSTGIETSRISRYRKPRKGSSDDVGGSDHSSNTIERIEIHVPVVNTSHSNDDDVRSVQVITGDDDDGDVTTTSDDGNDKGVNQDGNESQYENRQSRGVGHDHAKDSSDDDDGEEEEEKEEEEEEEEDSNEGSPDHGDNEAGDGTKHGHGNSHVPDLHSLADVRLGKDLLLDLMNVSVKEDGDGSLSGKQTIEDTEELAKTDSNVKAHESKVDSILKETNDSQDKGNVFSLGDPTVAEEKSDASLKKDTISVYNSSTASVGKDREDEDNLKKESDRIDVEKVLDNLMKKDVETTTEKGDGLVDTKKGFESLEKENEDSIKKKGESVEENGSGSLNSNIFGGKDGVTVVKDTSEDSGSIEEDGDTSVEKGASSVHVDGDIPIDVDGGTSVEENSGSIEEDGDTSVEENSGSIEEDGDTSVEKGASSVHVDGDTPIDVDGGTSVEENSGSIEEDGDTSVEKGASSVHVDGDTPIDVDGGTSVEENSGSIEEDGDTSVERDAGPVDVDGGTSVEAGAGPVDVDGGKSVEEGAGSVDVDGDTSVERDAGPVDVDGGTSVEKGADSVDVDGGTSVEAGAGPVDVDGDTSVEKGASSVDVDGGTSVEKGADSVDVDGDTSVEASAGSVDVDGDTSVERDAGPVDVDDGTSVEAGAGPVDVDSDTPVDEDGGTSIEKGAGSVEVVGGTSVEDVASVDEDGNVRREGKSRKLKVIQIDIRRGYGRVINAQKYRRGRGV